MQNAHFQLDIECTWMRESKIDWIFQIPACIVLVANLMFLLRIMWVSIPLQREEFHFFFSIFHLSIYRRLLLPLLLQVLITKLRSANTVETRQYRKASKALLVLIPLLGLTYLVVLAGPNEGVGSHIFVIARAFLLSTQVSGRDNYV